MDIKTRGPTNAIYGGYDDRIIQRSTSIPRPCIIEQIYEVLPQDNKRRERYELKKINTFEAKNSLSLHYSRIHQMVRFTLSPWTIWTPPYLGFVQSWVTTCHSSIYKLEAFLTPISIKNQLHTSSLSPKNSYSPDS